MGQLISLCAILFEGKQYAAGDSLPTYTPEMVKAWVEAGSAQWNPVRETTENLEPEPEESPKEPVPEAETGELEKEPISELPIRPKGRNER